MVGSMGNLYGSLESLSNGYLQPDLDKDLLLKPSHASTVQSPVLLLQDEDSATCTKSYYSCKGCRYFHYVTDSSGTLCPGCKGEMTTQVNFVGRDTSKVETTGDVGGYVKGVVTYMVMGDLVVSPMSTISSITLLNKFHVKEVGVLEEKTVKVGMKEGLSLLKASLNSSTVLSDVLLRKMY